MSSMKTAISAVRSLSRVAENALRGGKYPGYSRDIVSLGLDRETGFDAVALIDAMMRPDLAPGAGCGEDGSASMGERRETR